MQQVGEVWPYVDEEPMSYARRGSYQEPQRTMATYPDPLQPDYGPYYHSRGPLSADRGPPQQGSHFLYSGPSSPHFPENHTFQAGLPPYYDHGSLHGDGFQPHDQPYQPELGNLWQFSTQEYSTEESDFGEEEEEDEDEEGEEDEDEEVLNSLEEALQVNIQLPRLAVTAPPSVLPPKGRGLCCLPNLGNTCYLNVVLQCLYHTPGLPALLAQACKEQGDGDKERSTVAHALHSLMMKMDDVKKVKKGVLAYFKGVCGLKDEQFAGTEQQEAHDLLAGLLLWLHKDLASQEDVDCACTKNSTKKHSASTMTTNKNSNKKNHTSTPQGTASHHHHQTQQEKRPPKQPLQQKGYQYRPPNSQNYPPNFDIYPGSSHNYGPHNQVPYNQHLQYSHISNQPHQLSNNSYYYQQQLQEEDYTGPLDHFHNPEHNRQDDWDHTKPSDHHENSNKDQQAPKKLPKASSKSKTGQEGEVCGQCGVTYQRRSIISDMFEGICQQDIICPKGGLILNTTWERFTSLSLPVSGSSEITLEEALQHYFRISTFMWDCHYCNSSHPCDQQTRILCAPPILILHISRYLGKRNPRKQSVIFPIDGLDLQEHMKVTKSRIQQYGLYGVCNHHGTMQEGHYTACCKINKGHDKAANWYSFNDEEVRKVTHLKHPREAHILFYSTHNLKAMHP